MRDDLTIMEKVRRAKSLGKDYVVLTQDELLKVKRAVIRNATGSRTDLGAMDRLFGLEVRLEEPL